MKFWRSMMKLPQPVKGCLVACLITFAAAFVSVPAAALFGQDRLNPLTPWLMAALGLTAMVLGVVLAADLRGSAVAYASSSDCYVKAASSLGEERRTGA